MPLGLAERANTEDVHQWYGRASEAQSMAYSGLYTGVPPAEVLPNSIT